MAAASAFAGTGISDGRTFQFSRVESPFVRGSTFQVAGGALAVVDVDGDGRPDAVFLPGDVFAEREQSIREIDAAIRNNDGSFRFHTQTLPAALSGVRLEFGFGDVDGDLRTDLIAVVPIGAPLQPLSSPCFRQPTICHRPQPRSGNDIYFASV